MTITIEYSGALCSAGKTEFALGLMATTPGQYLYAVDRREVIETRIQRINEKAGAAGAHPVIRPIFSKGDEKFTTGSENVRRDLREQPTHDNDAPHAIIICTHEGLLSSDLSTYGGWTLIIDETPNLWTFREVGSQFTWPLFQQFFDLDPINEDHARVEIRRATPTVERLKKDTGLSDEFRDLLRRWQASRPVVNLTAWDQAADGGRWWWCSVWDATRLKVFRRVVILANSFEESLTYKLLKQQGVNLVPFSIRDDRVWQPRPILIRFFAEAHQAGTGFWTNPNDDDGAEALRRVFDWITRNSDPDDHFYSANVGALARTTLPGFKLQPKVSGSNSYQSLTSASFIYTAKPSIAELEALDLYGIGYDDVVRAREREDVIQFFWRSSIRVPDDARACEFRVYDRVQALFLAEFIEASGRPFTVVLEHVAEAGVDQFKPRRVGAPRKHRTPGEEAARKERRRRDGNQGRKDRRTRARQRDVEAGIVKRRGRPTKWLHAPR